MADSVEIEAPKPRMSWGKRLKRIALSLVVVIVFLLVFANAIVGAIATSWINKHGSEYAAEPLSVRSIKINWLFNGASIRGLTLGNPKGFSTSPLLFVERIDASISLASLTGKMPTVNSVLIDGVDLRMESKPEGTNVQALTNDLKALDEKAKKEGKKKEEAGPKAKSDKGFQLGEFKLTNSKIQFSEGGSKPRDFKIALKDLTVSDVVVPAPGTQSTQFLTFLMQEFQISNPGSVGNAVEVASCTFQFDTPSSVGGTYHIRKFETKGAKIQKVIPAEGDDNFTAMKLFLQDFAKQPEQASEAKTDEKSAEPKSEAAADAGPAKTTILDDLVVSGAQYQEVRDINGSPVIRTVTSIDLDLRDFVNPVQGGKIMKVKFSAKPYAEDALTTIDFTGNPQGPQSEWDLSFKVDARGLPVTAFANPSPKSPVIVKKGAAFANFSGTMKGSKLSSDVAVHVNDLDLAANGDSVTSKLKSTGYVATLSTLKKPGSNDTIEIKFPFQYDLSSKANAAELLSTAATAFLNAVFEQALNSAGKVGDIAKGATDAAKDVGGAVTGAAGEAAKGVTGAAGSAVSKATGGLGSLLGGGDKKDEKPETKTEEEPKKKSKKKSKD